MKITGTLFLISDVLQLNTLSLNKSSQNHVYINTMTKYKDNAKLYAKTENK